jgi:chemotaxis response regulator CheB
MSAQSRPDAPPEAGPPEVIALVASAGGLKAVTGVLEVLPPDLSAAVVVAQHLGDRSRLVQILARRTPLPVDWARSGARIRPGRVTVCPPHCVLELGPDGTCALRATGGALLTRSLDQLLRSLATGFGPRALAVVLSGTGVDGAAGAAAMRAAGGTVIAESDATAQFPAMPRAAIEAGAAQQVLALEEIGPAITAALAAWRARSGPVPARRP